VTTQKRSRPKRAHEQGHDFRSLLPSVGSVPATSSTGPNEHIAKHIRGVVHAELVSCETVQELEATLMQLRTNLGAFHSKGPGGYGSKQATILQQIVSQEVQHRRFQLGAGVSSGFDEEGSWGEAGTEGSHSPVPDQSAFLVERQFAHKCTRLATKRGEKGPPSPQAPLSPQSTKGEKGGGDPKWREAFARYTRNGRLHREDFTAALNLIAVPTTWWEEVYEKVSRGYMSVTMSEFVDFMNQYEQRRLVAYREAFDQADRDGSGSINVDELVEVLRRPPIGAQPQRRVLNDVILDIDRDGSGELDFDEFVELLDLLYAGNGFTRHEVEEFQTIFDRAAEPGTGTIAANELAGLLNWMGYQITVDDVGMVAEGVDVNGSGSLGFKEFLVCMRKVVELETNDVREVFNEFDKDNSKSISIEELEQLLYSLGHFANIDAIKEIARDAQIEDEMDMDNLLDFLRLYRKREGFTSDQIAEVDVAFKRYDPDDLGHTSYDDVSKAVRWLGYDTAAEVLEFLLKKVDVDRSGRINAQELRKLTRMYWDGELYKARTAFHKRCLATELVTSVEQAKAAFTELGMFDSFGATPSFEESDVNADGDVSLIPFMRLVIKFKLEAQQMYRSNGGYKHSEMVGLENLFRQYDKDGSGDVSLAELGKLLCQMFPVVTHTLRPKLHLLLQTVDASNKKTLSFRDFVHVCREFHDIRAATKLQKEQEAVKATGFEPDDVVSFRHVFQEMTIGDQVTFARIRQTIGNFCALGDKNRATLDEAMLQARKNREKEEIIPEILPSRQGLDEKDTLDFPEFLRLMWDLEERNFGNVKAKFSPGSEYNNNRGRCGSEDGLFEPTDSEVTGLSTVVSKSSSLAMHRRRSLLVRG
jgi:calmodulin